MEEKFVDICPFCGFKPFYDNKTQLVHCETLDCAISDFYIHIDEWNKRYDKGDKSK
jgi:hypothetical protein